MPKYHISLSGKHVVCLASNKPCPRGSEYHFDASTPEEAQIKADDFNEKYSLATKELTSILDTIHNLGDFKRPDGTILRDYLKEEQHKLAYDYYQEVKKLYKSDENNFYNTVAHLTREGKVDKNSDFYKEIKEDAKYYNNFDLENAVLNNSSSLVKPKTAKIDSNSVVLKTDKNGFFRKNYMTKVLNDPNTIMIVSSEYTDDYAYDAEINFNSGKILSDEERLYKARFLDTKYSSMRVDDNNQLKYYEFGNSYIINNPNIIINGELLIDKKIEQRKNELRELQRNGILDSSVDVEEKSKVEQKEKQKRLLAKKEKSRKNKEEPKKIISLEEVRKRRKKL